MRKRTILLSIVAAGIARAAASGWVTIRHGFSAAGKPFCDRKVGCATRGKKTLSWLGRPRRLRFGPVTADFR
jgi:hypothetical protein